MFENKMTGNFSETKNIWNLKMENLTSLND